jgi:HAD superfamily hydrolase (TIGR01509 family)
VQSLRAVLFDFAGTLFMPVAPEAMMAAALAALDLDLGRDEVERLARDYSRVGIAGGPYPDRVPDRLAALYAERDLSAENHRRAYVGLAATVDGPVALPHAFYEELLRPQSWVPYAHTVAVINGLRAQGIVVGVISNVGFDLRPVLRGHGLSGLAERLTMSYEVGVTKPGAEIFETALSKLGTTAAQTLMVGDNAEADVGGLALGMPTLLLPMTPPGSEHGLGAVLSLVATSLDQAD